MVIKLPLELKQQLLERIIAYFEQERGEPIGWIAAENMLDFMLGELGPIVYNQALADARALVLDRMQQLEDGSVCPGETSPCQALMALLD